jgi:hypothetical protein
MRGCYPVCLIAALTDLGGRISARRIGSIRRTTSPGMEPFEVGWRHYGSRRRHFDRALAASRSAEPVHDRWAPADQLSLRVPTLSMSHATMIGWRTAPGRTSLHADGGHLETIRGCVRCEPRASSGKKCCSRRPYAKVSFPSLPKPGLLCKPLISAFSSRLPSARTTWPLMA